MGLALACAAPTTAVHAFPDGNADVHHCGAGFDRVYYNVDNTGEPEAFDRFFNCEMVIEVRHEDRLAGAH